MDEQSTIKSTEDFKNSPEGKAARWSSEMRASSKMVKDFHEKADKVLDYYLDERDNKDESDSRVNLYWSGTKTMEAILYSSLPTVEVGRKFDDHNDDVARVAALMMKRTLNYDIIENGMEYDTMLKQAVQDRLTSGLTCARLFYESETETRTIPAILAEDGTELAPEVEDEVLIREDAPCRYYHWSDVRWSWSRTWADLRWVAFRNYLTRDEFKARFPEVDIREIKFKQQTTNPVDEASPEEDKDLWEKAEAWEIWDKQSRTVYWWTEGASKILDEKSDPLKLKGFFPCPRFLMANTTTRKLLPKPDFCLFQDLLLEIDNLQYRISVLTEAIRVVGVYDKQSEGVQRMLQEGTDNELIPVDNWAMFAEKGGIQGQIDWLPIEQVVNAVVNLRQMREDNIALLEKVTGMSDIIQGQGTHPREGVGTQKLKAEFGSVRLQSLQEEIAQYFVDICEIKAEIISKHFAPETIIELSNAQFLPDPDKQHLQPALELLKDWKAAALRVKVRTESMAMVNYDKLKADRTEYINAIALFMQSAAPILDKDAAAAPTLMELLKWGLAGFKGSSEIEGVIDQAIEQMNQKQQGGQGQPEDPAVQREKVKGENERQMAQITAQADLQKIEAKRRADLELVQAKFRADSTLIRMKTEGDISKEESQSAFAALQKEVDTQFDMLLAEKESELRKEEIREQASVSPDKESGG